MSMNLRISEMPELSALGDNDYLVLQHSSGNTKRSYKIPFSSFKTQFISKFNTIDVKSAAFCDASLFAPFAHGHDYTDFWYFPSYGPDSFNSNPDNVNPLCCVYDGKFTIVKYLPGVNERSINVISAYQPPATESLVNEAQTYADMHGIYKPGDLQFLAVKNFKDYLVKCRGYQLNGTGNIDINSQSFDGFVIPNGQRYVCATNKFKTACKLYSSSQSENAIEFTVPDLHNMFVKCDPGLPTSQMSPLQHIEHHNALIAHDHGGAFAANVNNIELELNNVIFEIYGADVGKQYKDTAHAGVGKLYDHPAYDEYKKAKPRIKEINIKCSVNAAECIVAGNDDESYPDYKDIQALLYIGMPDE